MRTLNPDRDCLLLPRSVRRRPSTGDREIWSLWGGDALDGGAHRGRDLSHYQAVRARRAAAELKAKADAEAEAKAELRRQEARRLTSVSHRPETAEEARPAPVAESLPEALGLDWGSYPLAVGPLTCPSCGTVGTFPRPTWLEAAVVLPYWEVPCPGCTATHRIYDKPYERAAAAALRRALAGAASR